MITMLVGKCRAVQHPSGSLNPAIHGPKPTGAAAYSNDRPTIQGFHVHLLSCELVCFSCSSSGYVIHMRWMEDIVLDWWEGDMTSY